MCPSFISHQKTVQNAGCGSYLGFFLLKWGVQWGNLSSSAQTCPCAQRDLASPQVPWGHGLALATQWILGLRHLLGLALALFQGWCLAGTSPVSAGVMTPRWWKPRAEIHSSDWIQELHRAPGASETVTAQLWPRLFEVRAGIWEQEAADISIIAKCVKSAVLQGTCWAGDSCWLWRTVAGWPSREQSPV